MYAKCYSQLYEKVILQVRPRVRAEGMRRLRALEELSYPQGIMIGPRTLGRKPYK